jgi:2-phosphosulfolactate phosphatase
VVFDDQSEFYERFEWGEAGLRRLAPNVDVVVIVDVLSFSTAVDVAVARGAIVYPFPWRDERAIEYARLVEAELAGDRMNPGTEGVLYSLSPMSLRVIPPGARLVLPSPNGATLATIASEMRSTVLVGCLRNAAAVATACRVIGKSIAVIAAGERWSEMGALRPAVEDLVGAGAILTSSRPVKPSPEARAAIAAFQGAARDLPGFLASCSSGKELAERGCAQDVEMAAQCNVSTAVPHLRDHAFKLWTPNSVKKA